MSFSDFEEDDSDDQASYGQRNCLPISTSLPSEAVDLDNFTPTSGPDYLYLVRKQALTFKGFSSSSTNNTRPSQKSDRQSLSHPMLQMIKGRKDVSSSFGPLHPGFVDFFTDLFRTERDNLCRAREELQANSQNFNPNETNNNPMLGSLPLEFSDIKEWLCPEPRTSECCGFRFPLVQLVAPLSQQCILTLIEMLGDWLVSDPDLAKPLSLWLFALLCALDPLLTASELYVLRSLVDSINNRMSPDTRRKGPFLFIISAIVIEVFGQRDLLY